MDYSKAKIYKILNDVDDDLYIGATCQSLSMRMVGHRKARTSTKHKNYKLYKRMNELGVEHFYIELVKETPCENKEQLNAIEGDYIRKYGTLNGKITGRTRKEWQDEHKERKSEQNKIRYENRKEEILAKQLQRQRENPERETERRKKYYMKKGEEIKTKDRERVECSFCGKELARGYLSRHTKKQHS